MPDIKIVHLNTSGTGGAAIACHRLHRLMLDANIHSDVIHLYDNCPHEKGFHFFEYKLIRRIFNHIFNKFIRKTLTPNAYIFSETAPLSSGIAGHPLLKNADVIYLHWVLGGFFSKKDFEKIAKLGKPVFCFTHDMWWITGGCHHAFDCDGYSCGCHTCPSRKHFASLARKQFLWKKQFYNKYPNVRFISPSIWLKNCAEKSNIGGGSGKCIVIPNVVPENTFKPIEKKAARDILGLPQDKIILSFGSAENRNKSKGFTYLQQALAHIQDNQILLCVYGCDYNEELVKGVNLPIHFLGRLEENEVALANAASDLFISPTLAESFGQTLLENIKCGTPVVSTNVTAVPEIVKDRVNGYLVPPKNSEQIAMAIRSFIKSPIVLNGSSETIFSDKYILDKHLELIKNILTK